MDAQIKIFNNPRFGEIRTIEIDNEPYFVGRDVAIVLGYARPENALFRHVDLDDTLKRGILTNGGVQETTLINESGLYSFIFRAKLQLAKEFKKWVTSEVLPSIRKTGGYIATQEDDTPETIMARALLVAKSTLDRQAEQIEAQKRQNEIISEQLSSVTEKLIRIAPKAAYAETILQSPNTYTTTQIAKELGMSAIALNRMLYSLGIQFKQSGQWMLYSKFQDRGLTATRTFPIYNEKGELTGTRIETVWTEKGRRAIHAKLNSLLNNKQLQESCTN